MSHYPNCDGNGEKISKSDLVKVEGKHLNIVEEVLHEQKVLYDFVPENGEPFDALGIVDRLTNRKLISWDLHHMFISEERSYGSIQCVYENGIFSFAHVDCSQYNEDNLPHTPEDEMYFHIYSVVNGLLKIK